MATGYSSSEAERIVHERINGVGAILGIATANPTLCIKCINAHGKSPWADSPTKSYCIAYPRELNMRKPPAVYYNGAYCERFIPESEGQEGTE